MNFLFENAHELAALLELPYIQRIVYLMGIRPKTGRPEAGSHTQHKPDI